MNANNNNNKKTQTKKQNRNTCKKCLNPFSFGISDDFYEPFDKDIFGFNHFENRMLKNFRNIFDFGFDETPIEEEKKEEEEKPKEVKPKEETKMEEEKED